MQAVLLQVTLPQSSARLRQAFHCFSETNTSQEVLRGADGIFWNIFFFLAASLQGIPDQTQSHS